MTGGSLRHKVTKSHVTNPKPKVYIYILLILAFKHSWVDSGRNLFLLGGMELGRLGTEGEREGETEGGWRAVGME